MAVLPHMRDRRQGRIVNITSIGGKVAAPHLLPYDCAKFAALGFSEGLRAELAREGVSVTTVIPGLMRTGSVVSVEYKGRAEEEFRWFTALARNPLVSMDVRTAARRILAAMRAGEGEVVLGWSAKVLRLGKELFPGVARQVLALVSRALPPQGTHAAALGKQIADQRRLRAFGAPVVSARGGQDPW
jgi:short-subunit dehydrogenase